MEPQKKRQKLDKPAKAPNYTPAENTLLYSLYKSNYEVYHSKFEGASKTYDVKPREQLLQEWSVRVSALGVAAREPGKLQDKLKKDLQTARTLLSKFKQAGRATGGGQPPVHPRRTHPQLMDLFDIAENTLAVTGIVSTETTEETTQPAEKCESALPQPSEPLHMGKRQLDDYQEFKMMDFENEEKDVSIPMTPTATSGRKEEKASGKKLLSKFSRKSLGHSLETVADQRSELIAQELRNAVLSGEKLRLEMELLRKQIRNVDAEYEIRYGNYLVNHGYIDREDHEGKVEDNKEESDEDDEDLVVDE